MIELNRQAILLLSSYFSSPARGEPTPLTPLEYGRFARWLKQNQFQPKDLFDHFDEIANGWADPKKKVTSERLQYLLGRGMAMGIALDRWKNAGIWFITRADSGYPSRLIECLGENAPALIFGVGNQQLLDGGGLSMVGSRNIEESDYQYTTQIAQQAAAEGLTVVSGGARGVDETAMFAALQVEGTAVGVLANDLFKAALSGKWRPYLKSNQVVLVSTYYPEARFNVGNAMGRNKYIYCLSDYGLVVRTDLEKGGTWSGATENRKRGWIPLFVKEPSDSVGNQALIEQGAIPLKDRSGDESVDSGDWLLQQLSSELKIEEEENVSQSTVAGGRETIEEQQEKKHTYAGVQQDLFS